jgi:hypothetical protein
MIFKRNESPPVHIVSRGDSSSTSKKRFIQNTELSKKIEYRGLDSSSEHTLVLDVVSALSPEGKEGANRSLQEKTTRVKFGRICG